VYIFAESQNDVITYQNPFVCTLLGVISYNAETKIAVCSLKDDKDTIIVGFLYHKFAELATDRHVQSRLPFKISIISGKIQFKGNSLNFEIYQCIFEKDFLINSSLLASHSFCEMSTYIHNHIYAYSPFNPAQIFGLIYHDYLMYLFEDSKLLSLQIESPLIPIKIKTAFQHAIYHNWRPLSAFNIDAQAFVDYFITYFGKKEQEFIQYELQKLRRYGDDYSFQAEVMVRSQIFGLQGRVDRILWNRSENSFTLFETKTGRTSFASENTAKFQLMAYYLILNEYYKQILKELLLEYPRNDVSNRLKLIEFEENEIIRLITMRNQIWAISIGRHPKEGPFKRCSPYCFQKDICSLYCLRSNLSVHCTDCERCNYHPILYDKEEFKEFRRINVYFDWFYQFLEMEYLNNQNLLTELGLSSKERESRGNGFSDVNITNISRITRRSIETEDYHESRSSNRLWITFEKKKSSNNTASFINTRINTSDFVLVTPQNYRPLTVQSIPGVVYQIQNDFVQIEVSAEYYMSIANLSSEELFRIDLVTSNRIINMEKSALDAFFRLPYQIGNENLKNIRKLLLNLKNDQIIPNQQVNREILTALEKQRYNRHQIQAIERALIFNDLLLIQGPPGSGKTTVIAEIVNQLVCKLQDTPNFIARERPKPSKDSPKESTVSYSKEMNSTGSNAEIVIESTVPEFLFQNNVISKKILLTAYTNRAVDNLVEMITKKYPHINILRVGAELSMAPNVKFTSLEVKSKQELYFADSQLYEINCPITAHKLINNATVIATTCLSINSVLMQNLEFDYVIIDEAGQVIEPVALISLLKAKRVILVGDDAQLPPISIQEHNPLLDTEFFEDKNYLQGFRGSILQLNLEDKYSNNSMELRKEIFLAELDELGIKSTDTLSISLFQRLKRKLQETPQFVFLTEQYRMHRTISDFISQQFYEQKLVPGIFNNQSVGDRDLSEYLATHKFPIPEKPLKLKSIKTLFQYIIQPDIPMIFLDTRNIEALDSKLDDSFDEMTSKFNEKEATLLVNIVTQAITEYLKIHIPVDNNCFKEFLSNIGIITPYRAQVRRIRSKLYEFYAIQQDIQEIVSTSVLIDTVDRFQGKESEIIFISLVDSNPNRELSTLYNELRRMNVSITRAKTKLILIGNSDMFMEKNLDKYHSIMDYLTPSNDSIPPLKGIHLKSTEKIRRFFTDLVHYIRIQKGYVLLNENFRFVIKK